MSRIQPEELQAFCTEALMQEGMRKEDAEVTARVLTRTDAFGTHSHGTKNLHNYIRKARAGGADLRAVPRVLTEGPAFVLLDGQKALGMVPSVRAMEMACRKAETEGIAIGVVRNSCHFGAAGYYANLAAEKGMIGLSMSNVDPNMTAPGARGMLLGNNPFAYAAPAGRMPSLFLDIAMSNVASLKVVQARKDGKTIPSTWIVDGEGLPTTDPSRYPQEGAMQPMAAHKGYGLAILVELLTGILSGGDTSMGGRIQSWCFRLEEPNRVCHAFVAIDPRHFLGEEALADRVEDMAQALRSAPKAKGAERIYTPGEMEWERCTAAAEEGIDLPPDVEESLRGLAQELGLTLPLRD